MKIVIGKDRIVHRTGHRQSFSDVWRARAEERGIENVLVDGFAHDATSRIAEAQADGFMWRYNFQKPWTDAAPRLLNAVEHGLGLPCWPPKAVRPFFEDKVAQSLFLDAAGIPTPRTWIFWKLDEALSGISQLNFPLVAKLSAGVQSDGVAIVRSEKEARSLAEQMFGSGRISLARSSSPLGRLLGHRAVSAKRAFANWPANKTESGYLYLQEFLPGNEFDTRLMLLGNKVVGFRRMNRPNDFRASGSGRVNPDHTAIDLRCVALIYKTADALRTDTLVTDMIFRDGEPVVNEFSQTMAPYLTADCTGHWTRANGDIVWVSEHVDPPVEIFDQFIASLETSVR